MAQDILDTVSTIRDAAVGRCRKRIEDAAKKAKKIIRRNPAEGENSGLCCEPQCGVTAVLKRKHGL